MLFRNLGLALLEVSSKKWSPADYCCSKRGYMSHRINSAFKEFRLQLTWVSVLVREGISFWSSAFGLVDLTFLSLSTHLSN